MPARALADFLDRNDVYYNCYNHPPAITAAEVAQSSHIPGDYMAKAVIVNVDGEMAMAVLPAHVYLDPERMAQSLQANSVSLAREEQFRHRFPLCEVGGEPPFGNLYGMKVYVDDALIKHDWLAFNAGTHTEVIKMGMGDFLRLSEAQSCSMAMLH